MDNVTGLCPQTTICLKRKESRSGIKPRSFRLPATSLTARPNRLTFLLARVKPFYSSCQVYSAVMGTNAFAEGFALCIHVQANIYQHDRF